MLRLSRFLKNWNPSPIQVRVETALYNQFGPTSKINVVDQSGGCGTAFAIEVHSEQFQNKRMLACHKLVKSALKQEMDEIHSVTLTTKAL